MWGLPPPDPTPRVATKCRDGRKPGRGGLLSELLEGTDSEAAVAHLGVRGTLSLHLGGQRVAGDIESAPGPFPGEPGSLSLPPGKLGRAFPPISIPHSGHPLQLH